MEVHPVKTRLLVQVRAHVQRLLSSDVSGHDWFHIKRVVGMARFIAKKEGADLYKVEMIALLHELDDYKLFDGSDNCENYLRSIGMEEKEIAFLVNACNEISFKGNGVDSRPSSLEAMIVQDADRLDALGAIGIARTFAYGGKKGQAIYDPDIQPQVHRSFEEYKQAKTTTINHFYEKLLLLKDLMNTGTGKKLAEKRHRYLERFIETFLDEWHSVDI